MLDMPLLLIVIIIFTLIFNYTNGAHDSANAIATIVSTKVLTPASAVIMAGILNFIGTFIGSEVAETIGGEIVEQKIIMDCQIILLAAIIAGLLWNIFTWYLGLPSSSSHALIGGLIGSAVAYGGWNSLKFVSIVEKIVLPLIFSPLAGFIGGYFLMVLLARLFFRANPKKSNFAFKKLQIVSSAFMAISHGMNDAQKSMGIISLALFSFRIIPVFTIPLWVRIICALTLFFGTATGGWKIIKTMGHKIFALEPVHGFAAETSAALVITGASLFGAPISTTHTISSSVLGVGSSKRFSAVRWGVATNMVIAWILTLPAAGIVGALCFYFLRLVGI